MSGAQSDGQMVGCGVAEGEVGGSENTFTLPRRRFCRKAPKLNDLDLKSRIRGRGNAGYSKQTLPRGIRLIDRTRRYFV